jgi:hypothetical protein
LDSSPDGTEEERLAEHPDLSEFSFGFVFSPGSEACITEENDSNKLGLFEGGDFCDDGHHHGHEKAGEELDHHAALVLGELVDEN